MIDLINKILRNSLAIMRKIFFKMTIMGDKRWSTPNEWPKLIYAFYCLWYHSLLPWKTGNSKSVVWCQIVIYFIAQVKFHVVSHHRFRNCGSSTISSMQFLNMEQLTKTLASLYILYEANHSSNSIHENEAEFRSLYVLLHLDSRNQQTVIFIIHWFCESYLLILNFSIVGS